MIEILEYDPRWPGEFELLAGPLRRALDGRGARVDHIGSTAVPGLAAKDVIDIQVTVAELEPAVEAALAGLGYARDPAITGDHRPPLDQRPERDWQKWYFRPPAGQRRTNLHVRRAGSANQRYALLFRDYLRAHPVAAGAYAEIKRQLARRHPDDWEAYYDLKDPACDLIWCAAEGWAAAEGWEG
ncbi:MAG TPA: GrpB family protein [Herpetosiphonaceae bacterium]